MFLADGQKRQNVLLSFLYIFLRHKPANLITLIPNIDNLNRN